MLALGEAQMVARPRHTFFRQHDADLLCAYRDVVVIEFQHRLFLWTNCRQTNVFNRGIVSCQAASPCHSGTVAGFVGSDTWITRYLSGCAVLALREMACRAFG